MKFTAILLCGAAALLLGAGPAARPTPIRADRLGTDVVVLGELGVPVGQLVTITGHRKTQPLFPGMPDMFVVDTVDGKAAPANTRLEVPGTGEWPDGTAATLKGWEVGTLRYTYFGANFAPDDPRRKAPHQQLSLTFEASEVVEPAGLKLAHGK